MAHVPRPSVLSLWPFFFGPWSIFQAASLRQDFCRNGSLRKGRGPWTKNREPRNMGTGSYILGRRFLVPAPWSLSRQRFNFVRTHFCRNIAGARWPRPRTDDQGPETHATCSWVLGPRSLSSVLGLEHLARAIFLQKWAPTK